MRVFRSSGSPAYLAAAVGLALLFFPHVGAPPSTLGVSTSSGSTSVAWKGSYQVVQHPLPDPHSQPWEIAGGPGGSVWFVEQAANQLGEYDPGNGTIRQYRIPTNGSTPDGVAADAGGNIWFTELTTNKLGELRAGSDKVVEYPIPGLEVNVGTTRQSVPCGPGAVLPDGSGSVWVACLYSSQIDRYVPDKGVFYIYNLPVFYSAPAGMLLDGKGNLWFTAADADMLGKAVLSQLVNNTSQGITEFAPINRTYLFKFNHLNSFLGGSNVITSSLPTPSGIAMSPSGTIWVTEHVDSSFDSYTPATGSLTRYWTSQTYGAFGFSSSFPNGIAIDGNGTVWIGEHYGNKILEFVPGSGAMTEYPVPCCTSNIAGVYSVTLDSGGNLWFVEINGNAIGELVKSPPSSGLSLTLPETSFSLGQKGTVTVPLVYKESGAAANTTTLQLSLSGTSSSGALETMTGEFTHSRLEVPPGGRASTELTLQANGIKPGAYYVTLGASASDGTIYSVVLKLTVRGPAYLDAEVIVPLALGLTAAAALGGLLVARRASRARRKIWRRPPSSRRLSLNSPNRITAAATAIPP